MNRSFTSTLVAVFGIAAIAWASSALLPVLGLASAALLFLLPVLYAATRGGVGAGLMAAVLGALAYNFFLLPPRFTFRVHGAENLVSLFVLVAVALVTSRLATRLMAREAEAIERAVASEEAAALSAELAAPPADTALARGLDHVASRYGAVRLLAEDALPEGDAAFSALDLAAAAWALHNGDATGHATAVMPAADWTFVPLAPRNRRGGEVAAVARPADGRTRSRGDLAQLTQLCLLLGQCRDRDAFEAERRERERLAEGDRLRRTFLASLAHDFRTPLTVITGRLALLAPGSGDARDALAAAQRLDRMMNDLLGAARIESGSLGAVLESIDPVDATSAALAALPPPPRIAVIRDIPADLPFVSADPLLLHHILVNLIDNALRHAAAAVRIGGRCAGGKVLIDVDDDGPGIPPAERTRVFERFARIEGSDRRSGSGLGLAIVKGFADAMGMTVTVDTAAAGGARFTLAIPLAAAPRP